MMMMMMTMIIIVHLIQDRLFEKCCGFFKVLDYLEVGRLGKQLDISNQGRRIAQTGDERPLSFISITSESDTQPWSNPNSIARKPTCY